MLGNLLLETSSDEGKRHEYSYFWSSELWIIMSSLHVYTFFSGTESSSLRFSLVFKNYT